MTSHLMRSYGVEIECYAPNGKTLESVAAAITAAGIDCHAEGYNHTTRRWWKLVKDRSVDPSDHSGYELVSPPMHFVDGARETALGCDALLRTGMTVTPKCGLHVHVDARRETIATLRRLAALYVESETIIDQLLPPSRRGGANRYCSSIADVSLSRIMSAPDAMSLAMILKPGDSDYRRYTKLNFTSILKYGTVEFRHHSGTLDGNKVNNWALACLRMVDVASKETGIVERVERVRAISTVRQGTKRAIVYNMLVRPEGCTTQEVCDATGWRQVSVSGVGHEYGLIISTTRSNGVRRYYGRMPLEGGVLNEVRRRGRNLRRPVDWVEHTDSPQIEHPKTLAGWIDRLGMTADEKDFWNKRAALFAQPSIGIANELDA